MKKLGILILCAILVLSLSACNQKNADIQEPVNFYYCRDEITYNTPDAVIRAEVHEGAGFLEDPEKMLRSYLLGPNSHNYVSLIPTNTTPVSVEITEGVAYVKFSDEFSKLSGMKLTTACSCIALTLSEYSGVNAVHISAETELLDNKDEIIITASDIILLDDEGKE